MLRSEQSGVRADMDACVIGELCEREKEAAHKDLAAITFVRDRRSEFPFSDILAPVETHVFVLLGGWRRVECGQHYVQVY